MSKWYNKPYFNRRNWLLDNAESFNISSNALFLCLILDYCKEFHLNISYDLLSSKLKCNKECLDGLVQELVQANYLKIFVGDNGVEYNIDNLFEASDERQLDCSSDLFKAFEDCLARPLNPTEMQKLADFMNEYSQEEIMNALRIADAYRKVSIPYIETILRNNHGSKN